MSKRDVDQQAKALRQLIDHAHQRDRIAKSGEGRARLTAALMTLGWGRRDAEQYIENARRRVRNAAENAQGKLDHILQHEAELWPWTEPRAAIKIMRLRTFGSFAEAPLTDIEQALIQKGNVLWIIAVYDALAMPILARLKISGGGGSEVPTRGDGEEQPAVSSREGVPGRGVEFTKVQKE